ncbi:hypothetical protein OAN96_01565 [Candidatus Gracilibacteria bacterium]|nr:hypothetical protein [Candidatus Gracilibacteria bacterium]
MEHSILLSIEVILFFLSLGFIVYYLGEKFIIKKGFNIDNLKARRNTIIEKKPLRKIVKKAKKGPIANSNVTEKSRISEKQKLRLIEIAKRVQVNSSKGYFDTAKNLIIEGLAIDNDNKDLNVELASIYEREKNFKNAQYIYEDLIVKLEDNYEVLKKLANCLALQGKLKKSIKQYKVAFEKKKSDMEVINALANLYFESEEYENCLTYAKLYVMQKPRNVDKLMMKGMCLEHIGKSSEAVSSYEKILQLQPYNSDVIKRIKELSHA